MIDVDPLRRKISGENYAESLRRRKDVEKANRESTIPSKASPGASAGDQIDVSDKAFMMSRIQKALAEIADVRTDLVTEIKARIEGDDYRIPGEVIAEKVIREALNEMKSFRHS